MENIYDRRYGCKCRHLKSKDLYNKSKERDKMSNKEEKSCASTSINWDSGANRKLSVTVDISDFQKNTFCIFNKK